MSTASNVYAALRSLQRVIPTSASAQFDALTRAIGDFAEDVNKDAAILKAQRDAFLEDKLCYQEALETIGKTCFFHIGDNKTAYKRSLYYCNKQVVEAFKKTNYDPGF